MNTQSTKHLEKETYSNQSNNEWKNCKECHARFKGQYKYFTS